METRKQALGKGLSALIPDSYTRSVEAQNKVLGKTEKMSEGAIQEIEISQIRSNREQPRNRFSDAGIEELANSIREQGVLQPVIVTNRPEGGYELICGERRVKAAERAGYLRIPAVVRELAEDKLLEWALVENIQREDLNAIEEARAYAKLIEQRALSHDDIARKVGKDRSTIANAIRLLKLPSEVLEWLVEGRIQAGHARALLALPTSEHQRQMAKRIVEERFSVRQVEELVGRESVKKRRAKKAREASPDILALEARLEERLGTRVRVFPKKKNKGRIEIQYYSLDDLDRILSLLRVEAL